MMGSMSEEMQTLQTRADEATRLESEIEEAKVNASHVEGLYQAEQASCSMGVVVPTRNTNLLLVILFFAKFFYPTSNNPAWC